MRVVNRKTFLALPAGTIYCKGVRWAFDSLSIKDDSLANDWFYLDPAWPSAQDCGEACELLGNSLETGSSFACEDAIGRDGCFDEDAVFLIFEKDDLTTLRSYIDRAIDLGQASSDPL
jgi:hypothetical protein